MPLPMAIEKVTADVPMIVGSTLNEFAGFAALMNPNYFQQSQSDIDATLKKMYGEKAEEYKQAFHYNPQNEMFTIYKTKRY